MAAKTRRKEPRTGVVHPLTWTERNDELRILLGCALVLLEQKYGDWREVCNATGLCYSTLWRYRTGRYSTKCQVETAMKLLGAAGLALRSAEYGLAVRIVK